MLLHLLSMDGLDSIWRLQPLLCAVPTTAPCECPMDELDRTDVSYPLRSGANVKSLVDSAQAELLEPDGSIKDRCTGKVQHTT